MNISDKKHSHSHQILRTNSHSSPKKLTEKQKQEFMERDKKYIGGKFLKDLEKVTF